MFVKAFQILHRNRKQSEPDVEDGAEGRASWGVRGGLAGVGGLKGGWHTLQGERLPRHQSNLL